MRDDALLAAAALPSDWPTRRLRFLASINDAKLPEGTAPDRALRYMDISSVRGDGSKQEPEGVLFEDAPTRARRLARAGDTAFSTVRTYLRAITYVEEDYADCVWSTGFAIVSPGPELDPRFLYHVARSKWFVAEVQRRSMGVSYPAINAEDIGDMLCPVPPLDEQRRVADFLDEIAREADAVLDHARRLDSLMSERLRALRERILATSARRARLKWYTGSIAQGESPQAEDRPAGPDEWGVLKLSAVHNGSFRPDEHKALPVAPERAALLPEDGDLLVTRANTPELVGDCCVVEKTEKRLFLPDLIYRIRIEPTHLLPRYAMHFLLSPTGRSRLEAAARGTSQSMVKLRGADILNVELPVPSLTQQAEIVRRLDAKQRATDAIVSKVAALEERVRERLDAFITAAVTGELDPTSYRASALTR